MTYQPNRYTDPWIQTASGKAFSVLNPTENMIDIHDIAHALSNLCRFAGHTRKFYSVAQHSMLVSYKVPTDLELEGLLHDATEAYVTDLPRPIKHSGLVEGFREIEDNIWKVIASKYDLALNHSKEVKEADARALLTEQRDLMGKQVKPWADTAIPFDHFILPVPPETAREQFIARFNKLYRERSERNAQKTERTAA
jgi:5'-deoxynucleotidase YfbR-like HD superfamily hydrolase